MKTCLDVSLNQAKDTALEAMAGPAKKPTRRAQSKEKTKACVLTCHSWSRRGRRRVGIGESQATRVRQSYVFPGSHRQRRLHCQMLHYVRGVQIHSPHSPFGLQRHVASTSVEAVDTQEPVARDRNCVGTEAELDAINLCIGRGNGAMQHNLRIARGASLWKNHRTQTLDLQTANQQALGNIGRGVSRIFSTGVFGTWGQNGVGLDVGLDVVGLGVVGAGVPTSSQSLPPLQKQHT